MVHLRCSQLSLSTFRALGSSHSWSCLPYRNTVTLSLDSSDTYTSTVQSAPPPSTDAALSRHPRLQTSYPHLPILYLLPLLLHPRPLLMAIFLRLLPPPPDSLRVLQWNAGGLRARSTELLHFLSSHPVDLICIQESNLNSSSFFRISGFSALRSDRTHSRSGILSPDTTHASGGVVIFVRQGLSFSELSTSTFSSLDPYSDYVGVNISLNNSSSVPFLNVYAPPIRSSPTDDRTDSFSPSILPSSRNLFILWDFNCHHPLWDSNGTSDPRGEEVFDWVISSDLLPLNDPDTPTLLHRSSGRRSSPDIFFALSTLAFSCSWEVLQDLGSNHLPILLSIPLSPVFRPNERPPSFNFQKARWNGFASYFDSHCPSEKEYSSLSFLSLSSAAALYTSLTLNAAKSSIPLGCIKRPPKAWWSAEVEKVVSERRKAFAAAYKSDEDRQAYISASRRASSVIAKAKAEHGRRLALLSHLGLTLNLYTLFFALSLALLPRLPPLLTFLTVLLLGNRFRFMPLTGDLTFLFLSQRPCAAEPEAISLSSAEPRALWSLTLPFALVSLRQNFLRLPPILPHPLPLAQTKLPIRC